MPASFETAWAATEDPDSWLARLPSIDPPPDPDVAGPGDRVRVTKISGADSEPALYVGAEGVVTYRYEHALTVEWDDARLNTVGIALLDGVDRWERLS